jgi:hypothetical protein
MQYLIASTLDNVLDPMAAIVGLLLPVFWDSWIAVLIAVLLGVTWLAVILTGQGPRVYLLPLVWVQVGVPQLLFALAGRYVLRPALRKRFE